MTNPQETKYSMALTTRDYTAQNIGKFEKLPLFSENNQLLANTIDEIQVVAGIQKTDKKGTTAAKAQLADNLIVISADNSRKLCAYAKLTNNLELLGEVNITETKLRRCADAALKDYAQIIYDQAQANVAALDQYGITPETQTEFLNAIKEYNAAIPAPRMKTTLTSQATKQLAVLFDKLDIALSNMDAVIEIIRLSQPNLYNGYKTARKIVNVGTGSLTIKGTITDAKTGKPLKGATIQFCPECVEPTMKAAANGINAAKEEVVLTKKTAEKGGFNIKSLPEGVYKVTVKMIGYKDQVVTVVINDEELSDLNIELAKN
jgi:hypothetical protein